MTTCGHPKCDFHSPSPNHSRCSGWCEGYESDDDIGLPKLNRIEDLLTPEQQQQLNDDLAEIARLRRRAEAEAGGIYLP